MKYYSDAEHYYFRRSLGDREIANKNDVEKIEPVIDLSPILGHPSRLFGKHGKADGMSNKTGWSDRLLSLIIGKVMRAVFTFVSLAFWYLNSSRTGLSPKL